MARRAAATILVALLVIGVSALRAQNTTPPHPLGLQFSTYLTGSATDEAGAIAVDASGNIYVTVQTNSVDFGQPRFLPPSQAALGFQRSVLMKIDPSGTVLYSRAFDNVLLDEVAVDGGGNVHVAGQPPLGVAKAEISIWKLDAAGNLVYAIRYGGSKGTSAGGIAADVSGGIVLAGWTNSDDLPVGGGGPACAGAVGPFSLPDVQGFVARFNASGALVTMRCIPGTGVSFANDVAVDRAGDIYVTGVTYSADFPASAGALQSTLRGSTCGFGFLTPCSDAFVMKLAGTDLRTIYATYLGGDRDDMASAIAVDSSGRAYLGGTSSSSDLATPGVVQTQCVQSSPSPLRGLPPCHDGFIAKINPAGSVLEFATYFGGAGLNDIITDVSAAVEGQVYFSGYAITDAAGFPRPPGTFAQPRDPIPAPGVTVPTENNIFVGVLNATGTTFNLVVLPGSDRAAGLAVMPTGTVHVAGRSRSTGFPLVRPLFSTPWGQTDAVLARFEPGRRRRWP